jgi:hypothetical protein
MFDSHHYHRHNHEVTKNVNVTEKRAPTDESVRLLREMELAAERRIEQSTRVENCPIDCVVHQSLDILNQQQLFAVIYRINGQQHRLDYKHNALKRDGHEEIALSLVDQLGRKIAADILARPFTEAMRKSRLA